MINITCYDLDGKIKAELQKLPLFSDSSNFHFFPLKNENISDFLSTESIDIIFVADNDKQVLSYNFITWLKETHPEIQIIFVSTKTDFKNVRKAFLQGIADYISFPFEYYQVEECINSLIQKKTDFYLTNKILDKVDSMLKFIFDGGENINDYIEDLVKTVFSDFHDSLSRQTVIEKIKSTSYKSMIARKPWFDKFLYKENFTSKVGFTIKEQEEILNELKYYYSELCWIFKKYNIIDDNPVTYMVGKYLIVHVDEKLTLSSVSQAVALNPSYISHIFKEKTDVSFNDFLNDVKIERSKVFLRNQNANIKSIAMDLEFNSTSYFARIFQDYVGISPSEYQKEQMDAQKDYSLHRLHLHCWKNKSL